jgi:hypothetical protein
VDGEKFSLYVDNYLPKLSSLLGIPTPEYHVVYTGQNTIEATASGCQIPGLDFSATYSGSPVVFANSVSFRVNSSGSTLPIDHKDVYFSVNDSDQMIQQKLADTIAYMNGCFGTNYTEMKIERYDRFNQTFVYLFANEESKPPADLVHIRNIPASEYTLLIFGKPIGSNEDNLYLQNVEIHKMIIPLHEHYIPLGNTKMLTVEEAEILLEKGYFFANGHFCPRCAGTGPEIDFSDYDGLELIYLHGENGIVVPFYAFYKELDSIGVAVVYVPAIEVDGLDEYFIQQMQKHK